ncbi:dTDP-4-dehydrorhamnose reductase [Mobiluncus curtisii]|uniref:dTDP-4-dehydrorhamnose reductase n=1 Tax=Mobiluncus curtisii TaxID=2051 RepID=UPI0001E0BD0A|nr:dTDP-4-dehydrorhamnose reductase [Mobiluncus curtisii]EFL93765.1 dTDP-4-dehydrorhamnose reductase [Mobiluncus curtisii subsp. curtisii ATCC 35241]NMW43376.1 dTDP-4-dehydrorhamnose reductase [Mobiluncus curtisii]NMW82680.1 dTDP-4-dehydrorhamnose reductase [Mobiluncus curtisii]NMW99496.1 dTDP-4-dehydrorhamnose reductase [Mobiluncus curtisii]NMX05250.1 dTDP-4-dehydrorhamnose reductase [Mobiluncus curtisii]
MRWIVVGANGMLGQDLVEMLQSQGEDVRTYDRPEIDLTVQSSVKEHVVEADVVVNTAAFTAVDKAEEQERAAFDINATAVQYLAAQCREIGARLVHISTDYVFDEPADRETPCEEYALPKPAGAYGRTKLAGEWALRSLSEDYLIVRTAWLYGAKGNCFPKTMARLAGEHDRLTVVADQYGQPTWTRDLADLIWRLISAKAPSGIYHGTAQGKTNWHGFTQAIVRSLGKDPSMVAPVTTADFPRPAPRPAFSVLAHKTIRDLGLEPIGPWEERWEVAAKEILADYLD